MNKHNLDLDVAGNGQEGIDLLLKKSYDIILMDLQMPVKDGYQTTIEIRKNLKLDTPIIAMTALALAMEKHKCFDIGMNSYLSKPFKQAELLGQIEKFAKNNQKKQPERKIDLSYLQDFSGGNANFIADMIQLFIKNVPADLEILESAVQNEDFSAMKKMAHQMKSSLSIFCLTEELEKAAIIENRSGADLSIDQISDALASLKNGLQSVIRAMEKMQPALCKDNPSRT